MNFRITDDVKQKDIDEIYNIGYEKVFSLEEYPYTGKRYYYIKKL